MHDRVRARRRPGPPRVAQVLGFAGLLPPAAAVVALLWQRPGAPPAGVIGLFALLYGGLILSFLGGLWWGAAAARLTDDEMGPVLALSVAPSLIALAALGLAAVSPLLTAAILAISLVAALRIDARLVRISALPTWWMTLRTPLSLGLALTMLAVGWLTA